MDKEIKSMAKTVNQLEAENKKLKLLLLAAGKLALSARSVTNATSKNISQRIEKMESDLDAYDNQIVTETNV